MVHQIALQLPHMNGKGYGKKCFAASKHFLPYLELEWYIERSVGFSLDLKILAIILTAFIGHDRIILTFTKHCFTVFQAIIFQ